MYDYEAKKLYINKAELEKVLGINLSEVKSRLLPVPNKNSTQSLVKRLNEIQIAHTLERKNAEINKLNARITELENTHIDTEKDSIIAQLQLENAELQTRISELENKAQQSAVDSESVLGNAKATRISKIQRDIFTLLVLKNYQGLESRNALFVCNQC